MSIMGIVILAIIILFAFLGMKKGLIRKISGILSLVITCVLVNFLLPYVTRVLKNNTPVYPFIVARCEEVVNLQAANLISEDMLYSYASSLGISPETAAAARESGQSLGAMLEQQGISAADLGMSVLSGLSRTEQTSLIRSLPVPEFVQKMIESYNNSEGYRKLEAADFAEYLVHFIADLILNLLSFLAAMVLTWVIVRLFIGSLHLFASLPVLGTADRIGGLLCGALEGFFVVWFLLLIMSFLAGTGAGAFLEEQLDKSLALWPLEQLNVFWAIITRAVEKML